MTGDKERSVFTRDPNHLWSDFGDRLWNLTFGSNLEQYGGGVRFREKEKREERQT